MRLGVLFSGGKDSCFACYKAMQRHEVACLISVISENRESYMFHTPNIGIIGMQAEAINLPLVSVKTKGEKEKELADLEKVIVKAKKEFKIEGIVTGAIDSVYQSTRIQKICNGLGLWCFNPLWQADQIKLLNETIASGFDVIIAGVFAYPLDEKFLGRKLDLHLINRLQDLQKKHKLSPSGEGGEIETFVLDGPIFKKRLKIIEAKNLWSGDSGTYEISKAKLVEK